MGLAAAAPLPLLPRLPRPPARVADGVELVVASVNIQQDDRARDAQARDLLAVDADVLLLCEHTKAAEEALDRAGLAERWPHRASDPDDAFFGSLVASRHPMARAERRDLGGRRGQVVDLDVEGVAVRVVPVHTQAPIHDHDLRTWLDTIAANAETGAAAGGPAVLAGDWNASGGNRHYRRTLARHGLVDAAAALGRRWQPTWPAEAAGGRVRTPPLLVLDHVVVTPDVEVVALERVRVADSDHRGLRATLRVPR